MAVMPFFCNGTFLVQGNLLRVLPVIIHNFTSNITNKVRNEDGESYIGTVTMTEAKHGIYRDCLGFTDF